MSTSPVRAVRVTAVPIRTVPVVPLTPGPPIHLPPTGGGGGGLTVDQLNALLTSDPPLLSIYLEASS